MALRELLRALEKDAEIRVAAVGAEARAAADRLSADASARLEQRRAADLAAREVELRAAASEEIEAARREATRRALLARAEALHRVFTHARAMLTRLEPDLTLQAGVGREIDAAQAYLGTTAGVVRCSHGWAATLKTALAGRSGLRLEPTKGIGAGMVVRAADGTVEVDATLERRLEQLWPRLAIELVRALEAPA
jgi:vacuolar-type H+-ATPase subunit E/Vma4